MSVYVYVFGYLLRILCEGRERERQKIFSRAFFWDFGISCFGCSSSAELSVLEFFSSLTNCFSLFFSLSRMCLTFFSPSFFFFFLPEREKERDLKRGDDDYKCKRTLLTARVRTSDEKQSTRACSDRAPISFSLRLFFFFPRERELFSLSDIFFCISLALSTSGNDDDNMSYDDVITKNQFDHLCFSEPTEHRQKEERHERRRSCGELRAIFFFCISLVYFFSLSLLLGKDRRARAERHGEKKKKKKSVSFVWR
jgi:hypothetical protein